jgi:Coenzyme PQQ synthesis protein D (PqqD)
LAGITPITVGGLLAGFERSPARELSYTISLWFPEEMEKSMSPTISDRSVVVAAKDQVSCDLAGEAAILNIKSGVYYGLDPVGARIWNLMQEPRAVVEIQNAITDEYDVEPERCARDLVSLLEKLLAEGLIELKVGTGG